MFLAWPDDAVPEKSMDWTKEGEGTTDSLLEG